MSSLSEADEKALAEVSSFQRDAARKELEAKAAAAAPKKTTTTTEMIVLIKPILFAFIKSTAVKQLIVDLLEGLVSSTENTLDDTAVEIIKKHLFPGEK